MNPKEFCYQLQQEIAGHTVRNCIGCRKTRNKIWRDQNKEKRKRDMRTWALKNKEHKSAYMRCYKQLHPEKFSSEKRLSNRKSQMARDPIRVKLLDLARNRRYREKHREKANERCRLHAKKNAAYYAAKAAERRAKLLRATPSWLNAEHKSQLLEIYKNRPPGFDVDHALPLQGKTVCGLHVPWNLQYLPLADNRRKGNRDG